MSGPAAGVPGGRRDEGPSLRRILGWAVVGALCVMALTATVAVLGGDFSDTDVRVLGSSLGFAVFSATGAAGAALRLRAGGWERDFGLGTAGVSALAFLLLLAAIWLDDTSSEELWRAWGVAGVMALATSHGSLVLAARRAGDSPAVRGLATTSLALGAVDALLAALAILGTIHVDDDSGYPRLLAVLLIAFLLTTALPPVLRRLRPAGAASRAAAPDPDPFGTSATKRDHLAAAVLESVERIEAATEDVGVRAECARLRAVVASPPRPRR